MGPGTLSVRQEGLGIRSAVQLAPSAFLASAAAPSVLVHQILPDHLHSNPYKTRDEALAAWKQDSDPHTSI